MYHQQDQQLEFKALSVSLAPAEDISIALTAGSDQNYAASKEREVKKKIRINLSRSLSHIHKSTKCSSQAKRLISKVPKNVDLHEVRTNPRIQQVPPFREASCSETHLRACLDVGTHSSHPLPAPLSPRVPFPILRLPHPGWHTFPRKGAPDPSAVRVSTHNRRFFEKNDNRFQFCPPLKMGFESHRRRLRKGPLTRRKPPRRPWPPPSRTCPRAAATPSSPACASTRAAACRRRTSSPSSAPSPA